MKKILSIILALGLVLSMSLAAMPAAAQTTPVGCGTVVPANDCAGATTTYTITFKSPVTLLAGNDILSFSFGAGTTFGTFVLGDVTVKGESVPLVNIVAAAPDIQFLLPVGASIAAGETVVVTIAKVKNPAAGKTTMKLGYKLACCDPVLFCSAEYTIRPAKSTYKWVIDHGVDPDDLIDFPFTVPPANELVNPLPDDIDPTFYPGIAQNFFPPTKYGDWNFWTVELKFDTKGCAGYEEVEVVVTLLDAPDGATVTSYWYGNNSTYGEPDNFMGWHGPVVQKFDATKAPPKTTSLAFELNDAYIDNGWAVTPMLTMANMPGEYTFCFELVATIPQECDDPDDLSLAKACYTHMEYQWLDADAIELFEKWNLVSLPLVPFDSSIESILEPLSLPGQLKSVWHYDRCEDGWFVHNPANNVTTLDDIEEARGYWFRMLKSDEKGYVAGGQTLWVFGTARPMPEFGPASYEICQGWTMLGFLPDWNGTPANKTAANYLWNFYSAFNQAEFGLVYGWDGAGQDWDVQAHSENLEPGSGYWIAFERNGTLYP